MILSSLLVASSLLAATEVVEENDYYYDRDRQCISSKATEACATMSELTLSTEAQDKTVSSADNSGLVVLNGTLSKTVPFEINGVPGFEVRIFDGTADPEGENGKWGNYLVEFHYGENISYDLNGNGSTEKILRYTSGQWISSTPDSYLVSAAGSYSRQTHDKLGECYDIPDCMSLLESKEVFPTAEEDTEESTEEESEVGTGNEESSTGSEGTNSGESSAPTYTTGETVTYTANENGIVSTPLSNNKYLRLSAGNEIEVTNLVCQNGDSGFSLLITNTKSEKNLSFNSCTDSKISWNEAVVNEGP